MEESGEYEDDAGLPRRGVSVGIRRQEVGEAYLDNEDEDGVLGVVSSGIGSLEDASLAGCSDHHGDSKPGKWYYSRTVRWNARNKAREEGQRGVSEADVRGSSTREYIQGTCPFPHTRRSMVGRRVANNRFLFRSQKARP